MTIDPMVTTAWLAGCLKDSRIKPVDASWFMPGDPRDGKTLFEQAHIPGAVFFDIDALSDPSSDLPHMLSDADSFGARIGDLGISDLDTVILYDAHGLFSAARAWWNFRVMGHEQVFVLDGGLPRWIAEGRPTVSGPSDPVPARFTPHLNLSLVRDLDQVAGILASRTEQVVDVRAAARFEGTAPEPRPGVRGGHMPGALNLPFNELIADGGLKPREDLIAVLTAAGVDPEEDVTATCGTGVTAAILALALQRVGLNRTAVYDGAWTEWGGRSDTPVVTGPA